MGAVTAPDGKIYLIGGLWSVSATRYKVKVYDPWTDSWEIKANMLTGRREMGVAVAQNGKIYAIGGVTGDAVTVANVEEYNPTTDTWLVRSAMPTARADLAAITASNGKIYAVGGLLPNGQYTDLVEEYDPVTDVWVTKPSMPTPRFELALAATPDGKIYAIGGGGAGGNLSKVEVYDVYTDNWSPTTSLSYPTRAPGAVAASNGHVYVVGGIRTTPLTNVSEYDPQTSTWLSLTPTPFGRWRHGLSITSDDKIYMFGGVDATGNLTRTVYEGILTLNNPPSVDAGGPYQVDEGESVLLSATGVDPENGPLTYAWDLDNNGSFETPGQSVNFSAVSLSPGVYTVVVQATDNGGLIATDDTTVTVEDIPTVDDFVILGAEGVWIKQNSIVYGGDVGASVASAGPYLDSGVETSIGKGVQITDTNSDVYGDSVKLKQGSQVQDVFYNDLSGLGTVLGDENMPIGTPIVSSFPTVPSFSPGEIDVTVQSDGIQTLAPGSYRDLRVNSGATLVFEEGVYNFNSWDIRTNAKVYFDGPVEIRIADKLDTLSGAEVRPSPTAAIDASDVTIFVTGINGSSGNLGATPKAAKFGENNIVGANIYVENGTLYLKQNTVATGSFIGKWVVGGISTEFSFDSAF